MSMNIHWDYDTNRPAPLPHVGKWKLEAKPLSWFKYKHGIYDEKLGKALDWFQPKEGEKRPPTIIPEAYDDGLLRDGHHRVHGLKILAKGKDLKIPVWVLHRDVKHDLPQQPTEPMRTSFDPPPEQTPAKADRYQAPAGGAIVNNQFLPGGKFLPQALKSIRAVMALRKRLAKRKAEGTARMAATTEPEKMVAPAIAAVAGTVLRAGAAIAPRVAAGGGRAAGAAGGTAGRAGGMGMGDILSVIPSPPPARQDDQQAQAAKKDIPPMALTEVIRKGKLLTPGTPRRQLQDHEIRKIEDAHGLEPHERLVRQVHPATGKVTTNLTHYYEFQDRLAQKRLGPALHLVLNDPGTADHIKEAHLTHHVLHDAGHILRGMSAHDVDQWYGSSMDGWEAAMHHLLSRERPGDPSSPHFPDHPQWGTYDHKTGKVMGSRTWMKLMKAPLAITSGSATPTKNARGAFRMVMSALRHHPANPFSHLPEVDHETYHKWREAARGALGLHADQPFEQVTQAGAPKHQALQDAANWHRKYGKLLDAHGVEPGYSAIVSVHHKDTGEPMGLLPFKSGEAIKPFPGKTQADLDAAKAAGKLTVVKSLPNPGPDGHLQPRGWGKQSAAIKASSRRLAQIIADHGEEGALKFLEEHQPISTIKKYNKGFNWGGATPQATAPGSFVFGPKYGPFYLNVSGKKDHFTLDKWMARLAYSYTGAMIDAKGGRAEGPRSAADSRLIVDAFKKAASHLRLAPADLQAVMWDMVQRVPNAFGVDHEEDDFKRGGQDLLTEHGIDPGIINPAPANARKGSGAGRRGGVSGTGKGGRGVARGKGPSRPKSAKAK